MRIPGVQISRLGRSGNPTLVPALLAAVLGGLTAGCGPGGEAPPPASIGDAPPPDAARGALAARAAAAKDLVAVSHYTLAGPRRSGRMITVVRAQDGSWRVDVPGGALGGTVDVSIVRTGDQLFHCASPVPPEPAGCVAVEAVPVEADPRVQHLFTDWLDVFTHRAAAVSVAPAAAPDGMAGDCFAVEPSAASLVAAVDGGTYCYREDGTLTGAELELGTLTLRDTDPAAPESVVLPGRIMTGGPLPTAAPPG